MSATDLAIVIVSIVALATVATLVAVVIQLRLTTQKLATTLEEVRSALSDSVGHVQDLTGDLDAEMKRVGGLLDTAEAVSARANTLSRITYGAVAKPVIKTAAVVKGTSRAARMLRKGSDALDERAG